MSQKTAERRTVRINGELIPPLERLVENAKDEYGIPLFRSKTDAVTQAVKEFLDKYKEDIEKEEA
jgi:hypothetical protein